MTYIFNPTTRQSKTVSSWAEWSLLCEIFSQNCSKSWLLLLNHSTSLASLAAQLQKERLIDNVYLAAPGSAYARVENVLKAKLVSLRKVNGSLFSKRTWTCRIRITWDLVKDADSQTPGLVNQAVSTSAAGDSDTCWCFETPDLWYLILWCTIKAHFDSENKRLHSIWTWIF